MKRGLVTIVLPIYNVEKYLERCLESIVNQTYRDLEIILVDDESPDKCPLICDNWAERDKRIKVIHKKNEGLGFARNTGIENATGEYIFFLDSDDYVAKDTIEKLYRIAQREKAQIVNYGFCKVGKDGLIKTKHIPNPKKLVYTGKEVQEEFLPNLIGPDLCTGENAKLWMSICGSFYSMELIEEAKWRLVSEREIISEDFYSLLCLYKDVKKVAVLPDALYFYCENETSLTHTYREDRYDKIKYFYKQCVKICNHIGYGKEVRKRLSYPYLSNTISALKMIEGADLTPQKKKEVYKRIFEDEMLHEVLDNLEIKKEKKARKVFLLTIKYKLYFMSKIFLRVKK